jgi:hypothetical protein
MMFVVVMVIVVSGVVGFWFYSQSTHPSGVVRFSIDRSVIKQGENATLKVTVENAGLEELFVEYRFKVNDKVSIYEGAEKLLPRTISGYTFNHTLEATHESETNVFVVTGMLEEGMLSATYSISLIVYFDEKEQEKTWNDLMLKVEA